MGDINDLKKWNTYKVTDMYRMFYNCKSLKNLDDISEWNISHVTNLYELFGNCESLEDMS